MLILIINPTAGGGRAVRTAGELRAELERRGIAYEMLYTTAPGHATLLARTAAARGDCEAVIAVGGDGTAFEAACGVQGSGVPLGIIPSGTGNDFVKTAGLPRRPLEALRFILTHRPRPVDIGRVNDRYFLNVCGTGFDVTVLEQAAALSGRFHGLLPYLVGVIRAIARFEPVHVRYEIDGREQERDVLLMSVANGRFIGGGIPICPAAALSDGLLDVVMVDVLPRWRIPFFLPGLMAGRILRFSVTHHIRCSRLRIERPMMSLQADGEIYRMDEADFEIMPGGLLLYW